MSFFGTRRPAASLIFIIGFLLMFLGIAFLVGSLTEISRLSILISFALLILGMFSAVFAIKLSRRSSYLFIAALLLQAGLFLFLYTIHVIPIKISQSWPMLSIFSGIALIPAGWYKFGKIKIMNIVLAVAFAMLGGFLMVFSLDLVDFSLAQFIHDWWPLLVALGGLTLVLTALGTRKFSAEPKNAGPRDSEDEEGDV